MPLTEKPGNDCQRHKKRTQQDIKALLDSISLPTMCFFYYRLSILINQVIFHNI